MTKHSAQKHRWLSVTGVAWTALTTKQTLAKSTCLKKRATSRRYLDHERSQKDVQDFETNLAGNEGTGVSEPSTRLPRSRRSVHVVPTSPRAAHGARRDQPYAKRALHKHLGRRYNDVQNLPQHTNAVCVHAAKRGCLRRCLYQHSRRCARRRALHLAPRRARRTRPTTHPALYSYVLPCGLLRVSTRLSPLRRLHASQSLAS